MALSVVAMNSPWLSIAGGNLVLNDMMSAGALVSFMLYVASLNGAFQVRKKNPNRIFNTTSILLVGGDSDSL